MVHASRIRLLNETPPNRTGQYVLYWMQASQRVSSNHALEFAIQKSNECALPLVVCFGLMDDYPEANERHYAFMLEGLADVQGGLVARGIRFVVRQGLPWEVALHYAKRASLLVCDRGYLRHQKRWRDRVADEAPCPVWQIESDVVVPVEAASVHHEYAAKTLRPKVHALLNEHLKPVKRVKLCKPSLALHVAGNLDVSDPTKLLRKLKIDRSVALTGHFAGGEVAAHARLKRFISTQLAGYAQGRNEPADAQSSALSPYLHFGQIGPIELALRVRTARTGSDADKDSFIEELIVRRELSMNFCNYHPKYDSWECLPGWAIKTLDKHARDRREFVYTREQLEQARTHDPYWNAAQKEMLLTGFMHNYMRMYWGKKIIEWTRDWREASATTLYLNNKYFLDGRDPNSYANVAWLYGLHDRPWGPERPIFGLVRYMNAAGLERKFDIERYVEKVNALDNRGFR